MQAISENKLLHHLDRVNGDFRPITADVFLTNYCNNRCSWCTFNRWERDSGSVGIPYADFVKYTERLVEVGVQGIILTGGGEPTINRDFDRITAFLEQKGVPYGINTNFNKLVFCKPEYLKVSLDGYSEASYEAVRGVRAYSTVRSNIVAFAAWKQRERLHTNLGIQMVVTDPADVIKFYEANGDLPVDYIVYRPIESTRGEYYKMPENLRAAEKAIIEINDLRSKDKRVILNYKWDMLQRGFGRCAAHWAQIALNEKGQVIYCCHKPYEVIGHILDEDILEKHTKARTDSRMCDVPCRLTAPNLFMENVLEKPVNVAFI